MTWKQVLFIFNPVSGRSQIRNHLLDILEILSAADYKVVCYPTKKKGDARRITRERTGDYLFIVCAGGDGTLDEVVSGMMENRDKPFVPIGYIPAGTTNDFASSLSIPSDMVKAAGVVAKGRTFKCDLGCFNDTDYFTYVAAFGIFTGTSYSTPQELKNQIGQLAYVLQGITELGQMRAYHMHVHAVVPLGENGDAAQNNVRNSMAGSLPAADTLNALAVKNEGDENSWVIDLDEEYALGLISNSRSIGGFQNPSVTRGDLQDGLFEVNLIRMPKNPLELSEILMTIGNVNVNSDMVRSFRASDIILSCNERIAWTRDGEYAGSFTQVRLTNRPRQIRIIVPEEFADRSFIDALPEARG